MGSSNTRSATELAAWTPVDIEFEGDVPSIDWGDLRALRFDGPFVDDTLARWAFATPRPEVVRTGPEALQVLDGAPSLDPAALIFHLSRCGSTLLSRLLRQVPGSVVISEAEIINKILLSSRGLVASQDKIRLFRWIVRALGRRRFGDERHLILKLSSWNVLHADLFTAAFPDARLIWLQRSPSEVLASMARQSPSWLRKPPSVICALLGLPERQIEDADHDQRAAFALEQLLLAAQKLDALVVDYEDLPDAAWKVVAPAIDLPVDASDIARMQVEARLSAKHGDGRPYQATQEVHPRNERIAELAARYADGDYRSLKQRQAP